MSQRPKLIRYESYATKSGARVELREFWVVRETPSGYWIASTLDHSGYSKRWMKKDKRHPFAVTDKEAARVSFVRRKWHQIEILKGQLSRAREALYQLQTEAEAAQLEGHEKWGS